MEIINHFSHEKHPLILKELKEEDTEEVCYGCQQPVLGSSYCCSECDVFLHKSCAEVALEITHPMHSEHPLKLFSTPSYRSKSCTSCNICLKDCNGFTYQCSKCEFDVDILCAQLQDTYKNPNHPHPLKLHKRPALFFCDACGAEKKDECYYCTVCPFWMHESCGSLPKSLSYKSHPRHDAPLSLSYCLPEEYRHYKLNCDICREKLHPSFWVYYCGPCRYFVHLKCFTSKSQQDEVAEADSAGEIPPNSISLPTDVVSSQLIQHFLKEKGLPVLIEHSKEINHFSHDHALILTEISDDYSEMDDDDQETVCSGCVEPISGSCYGCVQCNYFIHLHCVELPNNISSCYHPQHELSIDYYPEPFNYFRCCICDMHCTGFVYKCEECDFLLDIKCALLPTTIKHQGHDHLLLRSESSQRLLCNACNYFHTEIFFSCKTCEYNLAMRCALLPLIVRHRWDEHSFELSFPPFFYHPAAFMCDICEKEIHPKFWLYHCRKRECDNSFHLRCIPRLGFLPKIKFGGKLQINYHPHPLTFVRKIKYKFCCDKCDANLEGQVGFACEPCYFNLCLQCVRQIVDSSSEESVLEEFFKKILLLHEEFSSEEHSETEESSGED